MTHWLKFLKWVLSVNILCCNFNIAPNTCAWTPLFPFHSNEIFQTFLCVPGTKPSSGKCISSILCESRAVTIHISVTCDWQTFRKYYWASDTGGWGGRFTTSFSFFFFSSSLLPTCFSSYVVPPNHCSLDYISSPVFPSPAVLHFPLLHFCLLPLHLLWTLMSRLFRQCGLCLQAVRAGTLPTGTLNGTNWP